MRLALANSNGLGTPCYLPTFCCRLQVNLHQLKLRSSTSLSWDIRILKQKSGKDSTFWKNLPLGGASDAMVACELVALASLTTLQELEWPVKAIWKGRTMLAFRVPY